jgi:NAD(P)H-dependent nitrite reductase small subunit
MPTWHPTLPSSDIPDGRARHVEIDRARIAIYRVEDRFFAMSARCPHAGGAMAHGWVEDGEAVCPLHRWRFRLSDGRCTSVRGEALASFSCEVRDGVVWVAV